MPYFLMLLIYLLAAYLLWLTAIKLKDKWALLAWLPIGSDYLVVRLAKKPFYFLILMYIPLINIYYDFILWRAIFKRFNRNFLYAILMLIPLVNWIGLILVALIFKNPEAKIEGGEVKPIEAISAAKPEPARVEVEPTESREKPVADKDITK